MAKFLEGNDLNAAVGNILREAEEYLFLISPYIKLHSRIKDDLRRKIGNDKLEIVVVFGKNENDLSKSLNIEDLKFFMQFPNIKICHEPRLHAKFYGNEEKGILTSMNLYDYSQDKNIETGVLTEVSLLGMWNGIKDLDRDAFTYFAEVIEGSSIIFEKMPEYESRNLGLSKKYTGSTILKDITSDHFDLPADLIESPSVNLTAGKTIAIEEKPVKKQKLGYCIRTGVSIPFNPKRPFCDDAYKSWARYQDGDYREKYCHFSGEPSNGETSFSKPILKKNWKESLSK